MISQRAVCLSIALAVPALAATPALADIDPVATETPTLISEDRTAGPE